MRFRSPLLAILASAAFIAPLLGGQSVPAPGPPAWEAISIRPCAERGARGGGARLSPGRMALNCQPVTAFIGWAYVRYADGRAHAINAVGESGTAIEGGPSWINSDRYTIEATSAGTPSNAMMQGPMLQAILERRFKVKVHRETREVAVYNLTVAPGGPKLKPFKQGTCVPHEMVREDAGPRPLPAGQRYCGSFVEPTATTWSLQAEGASVEEFASLFLSGQTFVGRRVFNRTGIAGLYDIELEFAPPRSADDPSTATGVSIFTALREQLGLRLESTRGPGEFLVVDSIERPTEN
jgi:uncharacterized protein (TIGR03435 family)